MKERELSGRPVGGLLHLGGLDLIGLACGPWLAVG